MKIAIIGGGADPLECRFCHYEKQGQGIVCHSEIEKEWNTKEGELIIVKWVNINGFLKKKV